MGGRCQVGSHIDAAGEFLSDLPLESAPCGLTWLNLAARKLPVPGKAAPRAALRAQYVAVANDHCTDHFDRSLHSLIVEQLLCRALAVVGSMSPRREDYRWATYASWSESRLPSCSATMREVDMGQPAETAM